MTKLDYLQAYVDPATGLVIDTFADEPWEVQLVVLEAVLRHAYFAPAPVAPGHLASYLVMHVKPALELARHPSLAPPHPGLLALRLRLLLTPLHHWNPEAAPAAATPAQLRLLADLGVDVPRSGLTRGEASRLIDARKAEQRVEGTSCFVPWCSEAVGRAQEGLSRDAAGGRALCAFHLKALTVRECSDCGDPIDDAVWAYATKRVGTPLCLRHQAERGILAPGAGHKLRR